MQNETWEVVTLPISLPLSCPLLLRTVQKPDLHWPLDPPVFCRAQASPGPRTLTFYLLPMDFRQQFNRFKFSAVTCATLPDATKQPHLSGLNRWNRHYRRTLCFRRPNIVCFPQTWRRSFFSKNDKNISTLRLEWCSYVLHAKQAAVTLVSSLN